MLQIDYSVKENYSANITNNFVIHHLFKFDKNSRRHQNLF